MRATLPSSLPMRTSRVLSIGLPAQFYAIARRRVLTTRGCRARQGACWKSPPPFASKTLASARFQSWLDVEAALAEAQAELGIIPEGAAREIVRKAQLSFIDLDAVRAGLAKTGHPLVPLVWELDHACEGDAG